MKQENCELNQKYNRQQLKKIGDQTEIPTFNEIREAMDKTVSNKALAEDAMLQNIFSKRNFRLIGEEILKEQEDQQQYPSEILRKRPMTNE